jgi:ABC-type uncharacterized transport system substrate-binding protein
MEFLSQIDPWLALGVVLATAATDAVYVMFTSSVIARKRVAAANYSALWYTLSSFAVISYTNNWIYVVFAAVGSWVGAYLSMTWLHRPPGKPPAPISPDAVEP